MESQHNQSKLCKKCYQKIINFLKTKNNIKNLIIFNITTTDNFSKENKINPVIIFKCQNHYFGLFTRNNLRENPDQVNFQTKTVTLPTSLVIKKFKESKKNLDVKVNKNALVNVKSWPLAPVNSPFALEPRKKELAYFNKQQLKYYKVNVFNQHKHYFKTLFLKSNHRFTIISLLIGTLLLGLGIGGWQLFEDLNHPQPHVDRRINISQDGGDYYKAEAIIHNTSSKELLAAVQHIPNLNPDLQSAINDNTTILTTSDSLQYDGGYHLMKININAQHSEIFKGITSLTMNIKANKFDISWLDGNFTHKNAVHIGNIDPTNLLNALKLLPNLNPNLASVLREKGIEVINIKGKMIDDGLPHPINFTLDANNTNDFKGQLNCELNLISDKFDISNLKNDYTTSSPVTIHDTSFNSLVYLITSVVGMDKHLIAAAQDANIILTTASQLPADGQSHLLKVTMDATNTLAYSGRLTIMIPAIAGKMKINTLSQDLTTKPPVVEPNTDEESLRNALQKVQGINQTTLNVLKESNLLISTHSNLPDDGLPHEIDINLNAYKTLDYTGTATIKLMTKTIKTDITNDGGNYTSYGNIISNSVDSPALIKALKQIKQTNPVILSAINDPKVIVNTTSKLPQDDLIHDIEITINANQSQDYTGTAKILISMVYPKTDITNWNQDLTSSPPIVEPDLNSKELLDALTTVKGLAIDLKNILTLPGLTITTASKLIYDNKPHPITIVINADNTEHYKGQAKITLLITASTIDLSYFNGDYSADGDYTINGITQEELIKAITSDPHINPILKTAVQTPGITVSTTTKIPPNNSTVKTTIIIDGTHTKKYFGHATITMTLRNNSTAPFQINIGFKSHDSYNGTSSSDFHSETHILLDYFDYADSWDSFVKKYPSVTLNGSLSVHAWGEDGSLTNMKTTTTNIALNNPKTSPATWECKKSGSVIGNQLMAVWFYLWHDDHNIYWAFQRQEDSFWCSSGAYYYANLDNIYFGQ
ncbi:hypothetical protein [Spiroplasma eriocheiris]|uniref:Uncharacterized protein n=1 Tax=Spiroplasma eriocheiris TaxID=315358 RepID=A0A0H3XHL7_9MOLU|nr:hypothetical protein [Spiroplasma eriocheiris]AHF57753.1 hypothetical protein SPE_0625 [Spiroplasma eriocheiris CCTCC M 207170]AKM54203.1 hypothetical protein SERIO_v1c06330 [Spiroplasma eriocheiris]